jgi:hypothetical protein
MEQGKHSPRILEISWGHMEVEGLGAGKDFKLYPSGGRDWDWAETGTRHSPGIQPADVEELLAHGATTIALSQGMDKLLEVARPLTNTLEQRSITVYVAETSAAAEIYNKLTGSVAVGGLFHSTC